MRNQTPEESEVEKKIREEVDNTPGITFGYIGNFERWGDDRMLYLWVDGQRWEDGNRNQKDLWSCNATSLDKAALGRARIALRQFRMGYEAAKKEYQSK